MINLADAYTMYMNVVDRDGDTWRLSVRKIRATGEIIGLRLDAVTL